MYTSLCMYYRISEVKMEFLLFWIAVRLFLLLSTKSIFCAILDTRKKVIGKAGTNHEKEGAL